MLGDILELSGDGVVVELLLALIYDINGHDVLDSLESLLCILDEGVAEGAQEHPVNFLLEILDVSIKIDGIEALSEAVVGEQTSTVLGDVLLILSFVIQEVKLVVLA